MQFDYLEHGAAKSNGLFGTTNARCPDADWPDVGNLVEMTGRTSGMSIRAFAAHLVHAPAFAVPFIAKLFYKVAGIEVCPPGAVFMNVAIEGKFGTPLLVRLRQCAVGCILEQDAQ